MSLTPPRVRALEWLRSYAGPSLSRVASSAYLRRDVLLGALLASSIVVLLVLVTYLLLRGAFGNPAAPYSLELLAFALLHGGSVSVTVPPTPALLGIGGGAVLGLPATSFALLPFVLLLAASRYLAGRTGARAPFALVSTLVYAVLVGLVILLSGGTIESGGATFEVGAGPISAFANALLLAGVATALGVLAARGPVLPARARQVVRGALAALSLGGGVLSLLLIPVLLRARRARPGAPRQRGGTEQ